MAGAALRLRGVALHDRRQEAFHVAPGPDHLHRLTNVSNGTTYYYQVRAVNAVGPGPLSNELARDPGRPAPSPASGPTLTSATAGDGSVALTWTTPADGGRQLTGYEVWRATTAGSEAFHVTAPVGTSYTDYTNVSNGTTYYYQVRAVNAVGPGPLSNELRATPVAPRPPPPAAPTLTTATPGSGSVA